MYQGFKKYIPFQPVSLPDRTWPDKGGLPRRQYGAAWTFATAIRR